VESEQPGSCRVDVDVVVLIGIDGMVVIWEDVLGIDNVSFLITGGVSEGNGNRHSVGEGGIGGNIQIPV